LGSWRLSHLPEGVGLVQWARWLGPRGVRGGVGWMGSVDIMGGWMGGLRLIVRVSAIEWLECGANIGFY